MIAKVNVRESAEALAASHPCYSEEADRRYGRMHLPVAPHCNLGCRYCERTIGRRAAGADAPGVAAQVLTPEEALARVNRVADLGWVRVVGIAGPAEPLTSPETFETLRLVGAAHPEVVLCLSTNGLTLAEVLPELLEIGLRALTVTINATSVDIAEKLYAWAKVDGERLKGPEAASAILDRQWRGLEAAGRTGLLIKVNSVYVPGINDEDLVAVAQRALALGAHRHNIMPLIPRGRLRNHRPPTRREVEQVRLACEPWLDQIRHCTQCRADSIEPPDRTEMGDPLCGRGCEGLEAVECELIASSHGVTS